MKIINKPEPGSGMRQVVKKPKDSRFYSFGKVYENETRFYHKFVNLGYTVVMIVYDFSKKIVWFGTCFTFMFILPYAFLHLSDLMKLQAKIELDQRMSMGIDDIPFQH